MNSNNQALFDCFEDYMDELIDRFEEFTKKSLVLITAALGSIVLMAMYFLRQVSTRNHQSRIVQVSDKTGSKTFSRPRELTLKCSKSHKNKEKSSRKNTILSCDKGTGSPVHCCTNNITKRPSAEGKLISSRSSAEEKLIREVKLTACSKTCSSCYRRSSSRDSIKSRNLSPKTSPARPPTPNLEEKACATYTPPSFIPACIPKHHLSKSRQCSRNLGIRTSCCSMCCYDDDRR